MKTLETDPKKRARIKNNAFHNTSNVETAFKAADDSIFEVSKLKIRPSVLRRGRGRVNKKDTALFSLISMKAGDDLSITVDETDLSSPPSSPTSPSQTNKYCAIGSRQNEICI